MKALKIYNFCLGVSFALFIIGTLFKIQHWPFASLMMTIALFLIPIFYTLKFIATKDKVLFNYVGIVLLPAWAIHGLWKIAEFDYLKELTTGLMIAVAISALLLFLHAHRTKAAFKITASNILFLVGATLLILGVFVKIQHWPGSSVLLISSLFVSGFGFILQFFTKQS